MPRIRLLINVLEGAEEIGPASFQRGHVYPKKYHRKGCGQKGPTQSISFSNVSSGRRKLLTCNMTLPNEYISQGFVMSGMISVSIPARYNSGAAHLSAPPTVELRKDVA